MHDNSKNLTHERNTALILSGGFAKAAFWHAGVVLGLEERGIRIGDNNLSNNSGNIDTLVGSSAGALIGVLLTNDISAFDILESQLPPYKGKIPKINYSDIFNLGSISSGLDIFNSISHGDYKGLLNKLKSRSGLFSTSGIQTYLKNYVIKKNSYSSYKIDLFVTATQLDHSRKCVFGKYKFPNPKHDPTTHYYNNFPVDETVAASMSVPLLYKPVKIKNPNTNEYNYFLDGEIRDTLSTHVGVDNNCQRIISSWIYTPYHYQKEIGSLVNFGIPAIGIQSINLLIQKKIVSTRANFSAARDILQTVNEYCVDQKIDNTKRRKLLNILEIKLNYREKLKFIDIFPKFTDTDFFFRSVSSLSPKNIEKIVNLAKRRTIETLENEV